MKPLTAEAALAMVLRKREQRKEYRNRPEIKEKQRAYSRKYKATHILTPKELAKKQAYMKNYYKRPEVVARKKEQYKQMKLGYEMAKKAGLI